jgi:KipI family sensor histidine kinase inhibitor
MAMRLLPVNASTVLVELPGLDEVLALRASLTNQPLDGIEEMVPAARTLMLRVDPARLSVGHIADALAQRDLSASRSTPGAAQGPLVEIPVVYDGEDLAEVARLSGLTVEEVVRRHQDSEFTVAFCGFAPGFAYMVGGDPALQVPRRATPRPQVPAGSVALGGVYCGVYPQATPGGWQLIGRTPLAMWDADRDPPALLSPGTRVRFRAVEPVEAATPAAAPPFAVPAAAAAAATAATPAATCLEVTAAMMPALLQDLGRPGYGHLGVAPSGAADRTALQAANAAAGNPPDSPCVEVTFGSFAFRCRDDTGCGVVVAFAGAPAPIHVQRAAGEVLEGAAEQAIVLREGDSVKLGPPRRGLRTYLAVRGGFEAPRVLGSASRDTLAAIGPAPLLKGATLAVGTAPAHREVERQSTPRAAALPPLPTPADTVELDVVAGPRADWFTDEALATLCREAWQVTPQSSRVGLRLRGEQPLTRRDAAELPSEAVVRGAIQVPHDGQPVLLLADHPLTGGYPVIAVVAERHLDLAGQIPPGAKVRFRMR